MITVSLEASDQPEISIHPALFSNLNALCWLPPFLGLVPKAWYQTFTSESSVGHLRIHVYDF